MIDKNILGFETHAKEYTERFSDVSYYTKHLDLFSSMLSKRPKILDLACGPGNVSKYVFSQRCDSYFTCVDIAPSMIDIARQSMPKAQFIVSDIRKYEIAAGYYDGIICSFGLPFLNEKETSLFLQNIASGLKNGGFIYLSTMKGNSAGFEITSFSGETEVYFNYHRDDFINQQIEHNKLTVLKYEEQYFPQDGGEPLVDMIYILKK